MIQNFTFFWWFSNTLLTDLYWRNQNLWISIFNSQWVQWKSSFYSTPKRLDLKMGQNPNGHRYFTNPFSTLWSPRYWRLGKQWWMQILIRRSDSKDQTEVSCFWSCSSCQWNPKGWGNRFYQCLYWKKEF